MKCIKRIKSIILCLALGFSLLYVTAPMVPVDAATTVVHNFTTSGTSSSFFSITGNLSTSKGTVTYNGLTLTQCLKIESSTSITFNTTGSSTLKLVFNNESTTRIKVDGTNYAMTNGIVSVSLGAGSHTIAKTDVANLYYIELTTDGGTTPTATPTPTVTPTATPTPTTPPTSGDIILTPNGSMTLQQAINSVQPGKAIYLKAGAYKYSSTILIAEGNNGTSSAMKKIYAYGDGVPTVDFSAMSENSSNRGIVLAANYWHIKGITIKGAGDNGMLLAGHNNTIENCTFRENHDTGLQLSRYNTSYNSINQWPSNNLIIGCLSTENVDSGREDADGFAAKLTCGQGNRFENCTAIYNCDDGWDLYTKSDTGPIGVVTMVNCEASYNGKFTDGSLTGGDGNGFKLGDDTASVPHVLRNCKANYNAKHGYTGNGNPAKLVMDNCTGTGNGGKLFDRIN
ncbi:right-handed parallel beta-helix repeat-containing protein [Anaerocolumna sp. AGMB13020]|uniref:right-handed parallel beta-helix repeat-containing protein n=1 Tax=Anaerocolumna sp. AGMB13020 TaxID=3081750 RepID=UPI002953D48F|nr:right-handed parallel beta-helix repeat-containing protein [Anaerocolumna sp. AGMB13020]WOO37177.1 right-handed parallel beta-helix repeat-containing protein [Anaerocolumna sp. AGMB13020]